MTLVETVQRIEPARLEEPGAAIGDVVAELSAATAMLGKALHPIDALETLFPRVFPET